MLLSIKKQLRASVLPDGGQRCRIERLPSSLLEEKNSEEISGRRRELLTGVDSARRRDLSCHLSPSVHTRTHQERPLPLLWRLLHHPIMQSQDRLLHRKPAPAPSPFSEPRLDKRDDELYRDGRSVEPSKTGLLFGKVGLAVCEGRGRGRKATWS